MRLCVLALTAVTVLTAQGSADEFRIYTEPPRLLLTARRHKLLTRERERQSLRWVQFETLMKGKARMPEPAFAAALFHTVSGDAEAARAAAAAALAPGASVRDQALVLDWCGKALGDAEQERLKSALRGKLSARTDSIIALRDRVFAALALGDEAALNDAVRIWRRTLAPALRSGAAQLRHEDVYPLAELAHALRDNLHHDIRDDVPVLLRDMAQKRVLSYYPAPFPAAENEYRIPYYTGEREPDLQLASLTRAGELAFVAFEANAQEMQFLQGWLLHDRFLLRSPFGSPYEFLWANPYQPGLPFEKLPLSYHDPLSGTLLVRSSWEEDAQWAGIAPGFSQKFAEGRRQPLRPADSLRFDETAIAAGPASQREFAVGKEASLRWYLTGLQPRTEFDIEADGEGMFSAVSDPSGILALEFPRREGQTVLVHLPRRTEQLRIP